jgi:hypothetical protein
MTKRVGVAIVIGIIGVLGETAVLRHALVNCYPFKMLTYPPWQFYRQLGDGGAVVVAALAV